MKYIPYTILSICFAVFVLGVYFAGNPSQARAERYDQQRIEDFEGLHSGLYNYYQGNKKLPASLVDIDVYQKLEVVAPSEEDKIEVVTLLKMLRS